ncbi:hypothetical protein RRG08_052251 [Elysia crispata]|uniref:Uncharacterized protein n=1 Tax=Elysia crispata TaxID=231223 RepID=A0AAE1AXC4_9GAST|nr:hypothetical protein RRG08_052251 [Elysia crispata]
MAQHDDKRAKDHEEHLRLTVDITASQYLYGDDVKKMLKEAQENLHRVWDQTARASSEISCLIRKKKRGRSFLEEYRDKCLPKMSREPSKLAVTPSNVCRSDPDSPTATASATRTSPHAANMRNEMTLKISAWNIDQNAYTEDGILLFSNGTEPFDHVEKNRFGGVVAVDDYSYNAC